MKTLITKVNFLKDSPIKDRVNTRMDEFLKLRNHKEKVFSELCFCLLTANFKAEKSIEIQKKLENIFPTATEAELAIKLRTMGHRFWPQRAERIVLARNSFDELFFILDKHEHEIRDFIVKNIKGLGFKEASHFLRNIGYQDIAIIDFHIIDLLVAEKLIERPKAITPKKYLKIESILKKLANKLNLSLAELDLYLWYLETGKVLK